MLRCSCGPADIKEETGSETHHLKHDSSNPAVTQRFLSEIQRCSKTLPNAGKCCLFLTFQPVRSLNVRGDLFLYDYLMTTYVSFSSPCLLRKGHMFIYDHVLSLCFAGFHEERWRISWSCLQCAGLTHTSPAAVYWWRPNNRPKNLSVVRF